MCFHIIKYIIGDLGELSVEFFGDLGGISVGTKRRLFVLALETVFFC